MPTLDEQTLTDIMAGYGNFKLPTTAEAILTGNFAGLMPPPVAQALGMMMPTAAGMGGMPIGVPATPTPMYNPAAATAAQMPAVTAQMVAASVGQNMYNVGPIGPAHMGVFRPPGPAPSPFGQIPQLPNLAMGAVTPPVGTMQFHTPEAAYGSRDIMRQRVGMQDNQAIMEATASGLFRASAGAIGGAVGGTVGAFTGGAMGAWTGYDIGALAGTVAAPFIEAPFVDAMMWAGKPALLERARAQRLGMSSQGWVHGGGSMSPFGRGLGVMGAQQLNRGLGGLAKEFKGFNQEDMISMTQMAGDMGLLQMAQNPDQMTREMKKVIKAVGVIAKVTGDPDVQNAMKNIAQMRQLGLTALEAQGAFQNARTFGRMAGLTANEIVQGAGMMGANMGQNAGISAGTGMNLGVGAAGAVGAAIGGNAFTVRDLARYGGQEGMQQRLMGGFMGMLGGAGQTMLAGLIKMDASGNPVIDTERLKLAQNAPDLRKFLGQRQFGSADLEKILLNRSKLTDQLASELGPMGMMRFMGSIGQSVMKSSNGKISSLGGAFMTMGMSDVDASAMQDMLQSPGMYQNMLRQQRTTGVMDAVAASKEDAERSGIAWRSIKRLWGDANPLPGMRESIYGPVEDALARRDLREQYKEMGLGVREFGLLGGTEEARGLRLAIMEEGGPEAFRRKPSRMGLSGRAQSSIYRARGLGALGTMFGATATSGEDIRQENARAIQEMQHVTSVVGRGLTSTPEASAKRLEKLAQTFKTSVWSDTIDKTRAMMKREATWKSWTGGISQPDFANWRADIRKDLMKEPGFSKKSRQDQDAAVDEILKESVWLVGEEDPALGKDINRMLREETGTVTSSLIEEGFSDYEDTQERLSTRLENLTRQEHWLLGLTKTGERGEEIAKKTLSLLGELGGTPKEAEARLLKYQKFVRSSSGDRERMLRDKEFVKEITKVRGALEKTGTGGMFAEVASKERYNDAAAQETLTNILGASKAMARGQMRKNAQTLLSDRMGLGDLMGATDAGMQAALLEGGAGKFTPEQLEKIGGSIGGMYDVLGETFGEDALAAFRGEGAVPDLPSGASGEEKQLLEMKEMFADPANKMGTAADTFLAGVNLFTKDREAFSADRKAIVDAVLRLTTDRAE